MACCQRQLGQIKKNRGVALTLWSTLLLACGMTFGTFVRATAIPAVEPTEIDFGEQSAGTASEERIVTLKNEGDVDYSINLIAVTGNEFWVSHDCASGSDPQKIGTLTPNSSCSIRTSFIPTHLGGTENNLIIAGDAEPVLAVKLRGTGINGLSFLPPRLDFGAISLGRNARLSTRIRNTTDTAVRITKITTEDSNFSVIANTCTKSSSRLKPGASCKLTYRYRPLTDDSHSAGTTFDFDETNFPSGELLLTGSVGTPPPPTIRSTSPLSPTVAGIGERVTLNGDEGFTVKPGKILVGGKRAKIVAWTDKLVTFTVPGIIAGDYFVSIVRRDGQSASTEALGTGNNSYSLPIKIPRIDAIDPTEGFPKSTVTITGEFFGTGKPKVYFVPDGDLSATRFAAKVLKGNTSTVIATRVPKRLKPGKYQVVVKNAAGESESTEAGIFTVPQ